MKKNHFLIHFIFWETLCSKGAKCLLSSKFESEAILSLHTVFIAPTCYRRLALNYESTTMYNDDISLNSQEVQ